MTASAALRECMASCDVAQLLRIWPELFPAYPALDHHQALAVLHRARTESASVCKTARVYSHHWLIERGLPSGLPDELRPVIAEAVGISVRARDPLRADVANAIHDAMRDVVLDMYANGDTGPALVKRRMAEARSRVLRTA